MDNTGDVLSRLRPSTGAPFVQSVEPWEIDTLPYAAFPGKIIVVEDTGPLYEEAIQYLSSQTVLGFDTESKPTFSPRHRSHGVALLQLSGPDRAYLFRIKKMGIPDALKAVLADERITKVGAAVLDDVRGLQESEKFRPLGFVDLQRIVWKWGITDKSVKKMTAIILSLKVSKTQQLSNWEAPVLSPSQQKYAATDAWVCKQMYEKLLSTPECPVDGRPGVPIPPVGPDGKSLEVEEKKSAHATRRKVENTTSPFVFIDGVLTAKNSSPRKKKKKGPVPQQDAPASGAKAAEGTKKKKKKRKKKTSSSEGSAAPSQVPAPKEDA